MLVSDINFMMAMHVVVLISACFLGRYIVITRKMFIVSAGIPIVHLIFYFCVNFYLYKTNPALYDYLSGVKIVEDLNNSGELTEAYSRYSFVSSIMVNVLIIFYAFVYYFIANKEKKLLRSIGLTICLYLYYFYMNNIIQYMYYYFKGGSRDVLVAVISQTGKESYYMSMITVSVQFVITLGLLLILYFYYFKKKKFYNVRIRDRIIFVVWLVIFNIFPVYPLAKTNIEDQYLTLCYIFGALIPVLGWIAPALLMMNAAERSLKEKNEYQESYLNAELEYIEQYKRTQEATRAFRHDIINNLSLTNMMLDEGKTEEASEHLKALLGNVRALSPSVITGDEMLDCIVAMKADKMKELSIDFTADGVVDGGLHMKPMDVCSIFANAFDNAIEASNKMVPDAWVDLKIKRTEKFFILKISNSSVGKVDVQKLFMTAGYTSKKDTEHHGFGLRNIRNAVEEYDGLVKAESDDNSFALSIMIPRSE